MLSDLAQVVGPDLAPAEYDWYAIRVVVREGKFMRLNTNERTVAMKLMGEKGYSSEEVALVLRMKSSAVTKAWQRGYPIPRHEIPEDVVGGPIIPTKGNLLSRSEVQRITGR